MASQDEGVQILTQLGLTCSQARVYLALALSGMSTAKAISKVSKVAREHVYQIMPRLQELGLVEKVISVPTFFKAIPISDALFILLERRTRKTFELEAKTRDFLKNFIESKEKMTLQKKESQFILVPKKNAIIQMKKNKVEDAQTSIDCITILKRFLQIVFTYGEVINKALEKGVKIRVITQKPEDEESLPEIVKDFKKNPSYKLRYTLKPPPAVVTVYDKKEVFIITSPTADLAESPALWSNNPNLLAIVNTCFEAMWTTALENKHEEP